MLLMLLLALLGAALVFLAVAGIGRYVVDHKYMSPASVSARKAEIYAAFSGFVQKQELRGDDSAALAAWDAYGEYVSIHVFSPDGEGGGLLPTVSQYAGQYGKLFPLRFADGLYHIAIHDNTRARELMINNIAAVAAASVVFLLVLLGYVRRLTMRILRLSEEALTIGSGDLNHPITIQGSDELSMLAREMDAMRCSVIERMGNERRAWQANSELITAISHDIRTPMTALIGYLGLLNGSDFADKERCRQFSLSAQNKAMELKDLTDELFRYFLVFGRADLEMDMERFEAGLLLEQLLAEAAFELEEQGFHVQNIGLKADCAIEADPQYLKRVMDNLVSNIKKYADKTAPVLFLCQLEGGELSLCVSNTIARSAPRAESTKIGLRTCIKILQHMGGSFVTRSDEEHFAAELRLPTVK